MTKVLVVDDDRMVRHLVAGGLAAMKDVTVLQAADGNEALRLIEDESPAVVLLDVFLPDHNGLELIRKIKAISAKTPVIFITADTSSETAIQAMSSGAFDYLSKPLNVEQLRQLTSSAIRARQSMDEPVAFSIGEGVAGVERFVGCSKAMIEVYKSIGRVAQQNVTVLIRGESGCGKELVARALFQNSDRRSKPYVAVNCAAIPDQLLESELFGHEKGAFTGAERRRIGRFEQVDGGTIFLDEVGDMSSLIQGKVLRLLQEQRFERIGGNEEIRTDVRIIAATNRPLEQMVADGEFREDLLYRLNGFTIHLPPLRERPEDIPLLLEFFLRRAKHDMARPELEGLSPEGFQLLREYDWPGNVRQLQSVVRQAVLNTTGTVVDAGNLPDFIRTTSPSSVSVPVAASRVSEPAQASASAMASVAPAAPEPAATAESATTVTAPTADASSDDFSIVRFIDERLEAQSTDLYAETISQVEQRLFAKVLEMTQGNQSRAAEILGVTRGMVRDRVASFGIQFEKVVAVQKSDS